MVATRRQVQAEPDDNAILEEDPDLILKKKPVRRATAKTAATSKAETRPKTTRGKKAAPEPELEVEPEVSEAEAPPLKQKAGRPKKTAPKTSTEPVEDELKVTAKRAPAAKGGSVRGRRGAAAIEEEADEQPQKAPKAARSAKAGSLRGKKAVPVAAEADEVHEEVVEPVKAAKKGSVRGRKAAAAVEAPPLQAPDEPKPARQTRGATSKPQPLSPKKITQVSKPQTRNAKGANAKGAAKAAVTKPAANARSTRKRTVSDENEDVVVFNATTAAESEDDDVIVLSSTPKKAKATRSKKQTEPAPVNESDISMSSRPTTPTDSAPHSFNTIEEEDEPQEADVSDEEAELGVKHDSGGSEDELCGPKTPMKRSSPSAHARYQSSVQRTARKYDDDAQIGTPAMRFAVLGSQRSTPQTQKPYCKPTAPVSATRPMTVARATGKAFVFKDLRDGRPSPQKGNSMASEQEEASFLPDEDIISIDATPTPEEPIYLASSLEDAAASTNASIHEENETGFVAPADIEIVREDPDETVIVHEIGEDEQDADEEGVKSFHTEDTVLIDRPEQDTNMTDDMDSEEDAAGVHQSQAAAEFMQETPPRSGPQTPIVVNFDAHMKDTRSMHEDFGEYMITESAEEMPIAENMGIDAGAGAEIETDEEHSLIEATPRRQTVNFNDFIDVAALAEPTAVLNIDEAQTFEQVVDVEQAEQVQETQIPHYALPTIAFDARRKSLPSMSHRTPIKSGARPSTSDGTNIPRTASSFANAWWNRTRASSTATTPVKRPSTSHATPRAAAFGTPTKSRRTEVASTPVATPKERYPLLSSQKNYNGHANTVAPRTRFGTPSHKSPKRRETFHRGPPGLTKAAAADSGASTPAPSAAATPKERYPIFSGQAGYEDRAKTVTGPARFQTPPAKSPRRRQTFHKAATGQVNLHEAESEIDTPIASSIATPQPTTAERFPRLRPRKDYVDHAKTVAGPVRFQTPVKTPLKRPATAEKSDSLRRAALAANTPVPSHTSTKTPLKAPGMTPSQVPMTPHPAAPLRGVVAMVEVFTLEGASASAPFVALLHRLGAKTTRSWSDRVTHVVFKDGSPVTLQRVRLSNKDFEENGKGSHIHCVNSRWVTDCDTEGARVDESGEEYVVDVAEVPRGGKRRRKSMEPAALLNLGGNIVRDPKSSFGGKRSLSRSPFKVDSHATAAEETPRTTSEIDMIGKENSVDEQSSPATPAWIAAPGDLVQQTAPMKRVRKLELPEKEAKNRRLTFWNGAA